MLSERDRIENYSILIATCAPVIRLFLRTFVDMRREGGYPWSRSPQASNQQHGENSNSTGQHEMKPRSFSRAKARRDPDKSLFDDSCLLTTVDDEDKITLQQPGAGPSSSTNKDNNEAGYDGSIRPSGRNGVTVKTDIIVEVDEDSPPPPNEHAASLPPQAKSRSSSTYVWKFPG